MENSIKFKTLYAFSVSVTKEVEESTKSKNEADEEITVTKKVTKEVPTEACLKKPTRALIEESELYYNVLVSKGMQAGLMSVALLNKRLNNDGGTFSEEEKTAYDEKTAKLYNAYKNKQRVEVIAESNRSEGDVKVLNTAIQDIIFLGKQIRDFEISHSSIFNITAESRARTKTILWWLINLLHKKSDSGEWELVFKGETFEERLKYYNSIEDEDVELTKEEKEFMAQAMQKGSYAVVQWFYNRANKQEEFEALEKEL